MEIEMPRNSGLHFGPTEYQSLSPQEQSVLVRRLIRQAQIDRANAIRAALTDLLGWLGRAAIAIGARFARSYRAYAARRRYRQGMAELNALSDHELKDIGVRRSEIYWVVHHGRTVPDARASEPAVRPVRAETPAETGVGARKPRPPVHDDRRAAA
jgi:uncharacterized protein YjiS (DUF1127 family)